MGDFQIVRLTPEQWELYREIRLEMLSEEPQAFGSTYTQMEKMTPDFWQGRLANAALGEESSLIFAQKGERLIGMIGAFYEQTQATAHIISVYVSKTARGKGVGKALMEGILSEIRQKKDIRKAALGVNQEQKAAVELYRRFGFVVTEEKEQVQGDGKLVRGYWMEKQLE